MDVVVFGAGSIGSLLGGLLATEHRVTLVGRDPHVETIAAEGLRIEGEIERRVRPRSTTELEPGHAADLAVVTVKAYDTAAAADALATVDLGAALSLQNGMGNEATLEARLDCPVLAGTTTYGAIQAAPGVVECTGVGEVVLGPWAAAETDDAAGPEAVDEKTTDLDLAERVGRAFEAAGIRTTVDPDVRGRLWEKLAVNAAINPVTALARVRNGALVDGPAGEVAEAAALEVAAVAREAGIDLADDEAADAVTEVAEATAANRSSMLRDLAAGRRTEIDAINGYVVDRATAPVPVNRTLATLVRASGLSGDR